MNDASEVEYQLPRSSRKTNGRLPVWLAVLLVIVLLIKLSELPRPVVSRTAVRGASGTISQDADDRAMSMLLLITLKTKLFVLQQNVSGIPTGSSQKSAKSLLDESEKLFKLANYSPASARRVFIIRGLFHRPLLAPTRLGYLPLQAFAGSPNISLRNEGNVWVAIANKTVLTPVQIVSMSKQIRRAPGIGWWKYSALELFYDSQGMTSEAHAYADESRGQAVSTLGALGLLLVIALFAFFVGAGAIVYLVATSRGRKTAIPSPLVAIANGYDPANNKAPDAWPTVPERIRDVDRKLSSTDLLAIFALYMLVPSVLSIMAKGFPGIGRNHLFALRGLLTHYGASIAAGKPNHPDVAIAIITTAAYLISAAIPLGCLKWLAVKRGASLRNELNFTARPVGKNLVYGLVGYGIGLVVLFVSGFASSQILRGVPSPPNPAIPLLMGSTSTAAIIILLAVVSIGAPLTEEPMFRGVLYQGLRMRFGPWPSIVASGFIFGFAHPVGIAGMVPLAMLGCVLAWIAETRKSLFPGMVVHCLQNLGTSAMIILAFTR